MVIHTRRQPEPLPVTPEPLYQFLLLLTHLGDSHSASFLIQYRKLGTSINR